MADKVFELNTAGVGELLKSSGAMAVCSQYAAQYASKCGSGYSHDEYTGGKRAMASVYTVDFDGCLDEHRNKTLEKVFGI
ncbi:MAG: hypothetical protein LUD47_01485 [Clostridia bacterium]|nr:hypothetical protein [Clostridia bacterium]